ncbi:hypothetical protein LOC68_19965 [Blastopirellula sp. JC732]|uniref:Uncharacterized protein n=1 Tax=Blastopirellula sediminis TaxID=2894196 RepID=A0A9X1MQP7_9BACT|nr:hypothetical protein [Blastopirellula sediminis]MCC9606024.1 hypothetical protein [Blastopirellula sediminis]MCC9630677.1 hypothetical protein [Blastopirellula sediminis]
MNSETANQPLDVVLSASGKTFINGVEALLDAHLRRLCSQERCARSVRIFAGEECRFDHVTEIFRVCRHWGVADISLAG